MWPVFFREKKQATFERFKGQGMNQIASIKNEKEEVYWYKEQVLGSPSVLNQVLPSTLNM